MVARVAQVQSFDEDSLKKLDESVNKWIIEQVSKAKDTGYSTKNIQYQTVPRPNGGMAFMATVTYIINTGIATIERKK